MTVRGKARVLVYGIFVAYVTKRASSVNGVLSNAIRICASIIRGFEFDPIAFLINNSKLIKAYSMHCTLVAIEGKLVCG